MPNFFRRFIFLTVCALAALIAEQTEAFAGVRLALVLGNSKYQAVPELDNPANDAADLAQALRGVGFEVIEQRDASREAMAKAVHDFSDRLRGADVAVFFYAGHGMQMNGENYLLPVDAKIESPADVRFNTINLTDIQQEMEGSGAGRANIIILDACRNNPFIEKLAHGGRAAPTRGLGRVEATGEGSLIVYSTQPNNIALDGMGRNSPFTSALLKHIATPGLEVRQMISKVRGDVLAATEKRQTPWDSSSLVGDVYLAGAPEPANAPAAASPPAQPVVVAQTAPSSTRAPDGGAPAAPENSPAPPSASSASGPAGECENLAAPLPPFSGFEQIMKARSVNWQAALQACEAAVKEKPDDPHLQYLLGRSHNGMKNYFLAVQHFTLAANAGYAPAQSELGANIVRGQGAVKDYARAFDLIDKAATAGVPEAINNLGSLYANGWGVSKDNAKSLALHEKAIDAGSSFALGQTGEAYFNGQGAPRDFDAAAQYFQQAANLGDGYSMKFLAMMYEHGLIGPADPSKAAQLRLRAAQLDPDGPTPPDVFKSTAAPRPTHYAAHTVRVIRRYRFIGFGLGCFGVWC